MTSGASARSHLSQVPQREILSALRCRVLANPRLHCGSASTSRAPLDRVRLTPEAAWGSLAALPEEGKKLDLSQSPDFAVVPGTALSNMTSPGRIPSQGGRMRRSEQGQGRRAAPGVRCKVEQRPAQRRSIGDQVAAAAQFSILQPHLREDIRSSVAVGIDGEASFGCPPRPLSVFRHSIRDALLVDESRLELLLRGVEADGSSKDLAAVRVKQYVGGVRLAVSRVVAALQGSLAELLAVGPCTQLLRDLVRQGRIPPLARLYFGDAVLAPRLRGSATAKAADLHVLVPEPCTGSMTLVGVGEVKSYLCSQTRIRAQLDKHLARLKRGHVSLPGSGGPPRTMCAVRATRHPLRISVLPGSWHLSRHYEIAPGRESTWLAVSPPHPQDSVSFVHQGLDEWRIVLRWSHEALASSAFEILHWYLGRLGEAVYTEPGASPWPDLSPEKAGRHAVVMMLYYALLQSLDPVTEAQLAKLYNVLGFGYALGAHFRGPEGRVKMLWSADLDEILRDGRTRDGSRIVP